MNRATLSVLLAACSSSNVTSSPPPSHCDRTARVGTYYAEWTEQAGGSCGPYKNGLLVLTDKSPAGCTLVYERWGENDCKLERSGSCTYDVPDPTAWGGRGTLVEKTVAVSRDLVGDGSRIQGTTTRTISDGTSSCGSTYSVTLTRQ